MANMYHFVSAYSSLGIGLLSSLGIGLVGVALFSWIPVGMTYISIVVGALACLGTGIFILITQSTYTYCESVWKRSVRQSASSLQ